MSEGGIDWIKVGIRVTVKDKNFDGTVRFFGTTDFAPGKWVGVELDEPKGKNNGVVKGKVYFTCRDSHGLFVRTSQIEPLSSSPPSHSGIPMPKSTPKARGPISKSPASPSVKRSNLPKPSKGGAEQEPNKTPPLPRSSPTVPKIEEEKPVSFAPTINVTEATSSADDVLKQKLAILQQKRAEDKAKIKELEKIRLQFQQMLEYKSKWTESQADLQQQLKQAKKEAKEAVFLKEQFEEEMRDLSDTVEIATLDKEMAEEKCEGLQAENEALKEKIQELTIDLEILQNEISESGYEGAAASGQLKQLEQQNNRLKEALMKLRDVSNQEKTEHQRVLKDFEKQIATVNTLKEQKDRLEEELKASDDLISSLKEQVDVAMGAEDMVEKLTDTNLQLEEELNRLTETVNDLEALRDLTEQQEELRIEEEHELREELDLNMNTVRQLERRLEASQDSIVDQQQTIEKFRELVRHLQSELAELKKQPEEGGSGREPSPAAPDTVLNQLKSSALKAYSRTIDYELRKLEAQQAVELINHLKSFMPSSFTSSGGDYDALNVTMLLPRLVIKANLIIDQLKQQTGFDETMTSLNSVKSNSGKVDLLSYASLLVYKLTTLEMLVNQAMRVMYECDVQLYRQMGGLLDDLKLHERALDLLIELLKKEQLDESVALNGIEKAINHFELLLHTRLTLTVQKEKTEFLLDQIKVLAAGLDYSIIELYHIRSFTSEGSGFLTQLKELDTLCSDLHQSCRKIRRRVPAPTSGKTVDCPPDLLPKLLSQQKLLVTSFRVLYTKVHQKAQGLTEGESLSNGELQSFYEEVAKLVLQELLTSEETQPEEVIHVCLSKSGKVLETFLSNLQDGEYDSPVSKAKIQSPLETRAQTVKAELSDQEGLKFKIEEKNVEIEELKKTIRLKDNKVGEINVKVKLLEKNLEVADAECARKVEEEKMETERIKTLKDSQEWKFNKAIEVLQSDMQLLEKERDTLKQQLETQSHTPISPNMSGSRRTKSFGNRQTIAAILASRSPQPHRGQSAPQATSLDDVKDVEEIPDSPLLLGQIDSLKKALSFSQEENAQLKTRIAKAKLASLSPLRVPQRLASYHTQPSPDVKEDGKETTPTQKSLVEETSTLLESLNSVVAGAHVVDITKRPEGKDSISPQDRLAQQVLSIMELRQKAAKLKQKAQVHLASAHKGGMVNSSVRPFVSPQFAKALAENQAPPLLARVRLPPHASDTSCRSASTRHKVFLSANQFEALHTELIA